MKLPVSAVVEAVGVTFTDTASTTHHSCATIDFKPHGANFTLNMSIESTDYAKLGKLMLVVDATHAVPTPPLVPIWGWILIGIIAVFCLVVTPFIVWKGWDYKKKLQTPAALDYVSVTEDEDDEPQTKGKKRKFKKKKVLPWNPRNRQAKFGNLGGYRVSSPKSKKVRRKKSMFDQSIVEGPKANPPIVVDKQAEKQKDEQLKAEKQEKEQLKVVDEQVEPLKVEELKAEKQEKEQLKVVDEQVEPLDVEEPELKTAESLSFVVPKFKDGNVKKVKSKRSSHGRKQQKVAKKTRPKDQQRTEKPDAPTSQEVTIAPTDGLKMKVHKRKMPKVKVFKSKVPKSVMPRRKMPKDKNAKAETVGTSGTFSTGTLDKKVAAEKFDFQELKHDWKFLINPAFRPFCKLENKQFRDPVPPTFVYSMSTNAQEYQLKRRTAETVEEREERLRKMTIEPLVPGTGPSTADTAKNSNAADVVAPDDPLLQFNAIRLMSFMEPWSLRLVLYFPLDANLVGKECQHAAKQLRDKLTDPGLTKAEIIWLNDSLERVNKVSQVCYDIMASQSGMVTFQLPWAFRDALEIGYMSNLERNAALDWDPLGLAQIEFITRWCNEKMADIRTLNEGKNKDEYKRDLEAIMTLLQFTQHARRVLNSGLFKDVGWNAKAKGVRATDAVDDDENVELVPDMLEKPAEETAKQAQEKRD